jgi:cytosine/adenosine deaminase-related metal-dependent hydrolase
MLLRARTVMPIARPPIEDGAVGVSGGQITAVGRWRDLRNGHKLVEDLGEVILMPGLINAHCHLDYSHMAGCLPPTRHFPDWLKGILALKAHWSYSEYAQSWLAGAHMMLNSGTTTVVDIEAVPELLPEVWTATSLRVISLLELTNVRSRQSPAGILGGARKTIRQLPAGRCSAGLSPHALYSTTPELLRQAAQLARQRHWPLAIHVAESLDEFEMYTRRTGRMYDWLKVQRDMADCGDLTPVEQLAKLGVLSSNLLAVHVNYFTPDDAALLAKHKTSVVHCPRCHTYFQHRPFDIYALERARVNVCLGTDSLASILKHRGRKLVLNLFDEMREMAGKYPELMPETILKMATVNGARALRKKGRLGELSVGALADLIAIPYPTPCQNPARWLVESGSTPCAVMVSGAWAGNHK